MFELQNDGGGRIRLTGRLDAEHADDARAELAAVNEPLTLDCSDLEYISSAGIGVIMETYSRLLKAGHGLRLVQLKPPVRNVFRYSGLDRVLKID